VIYTLARDLEERMQSRQFPVQIEYGPLRFPPAIGTSGIITLGRDYGKSDAIAPAQGKANTAEQRPVWNRDLACIAVIYAQSTLDGAGIHDHERVCEQYVDAFACALAWWASHPDVRAKLPVPTEMRYMTPADFPDEMRPQIETWPGVAYMIRFPVARGVRDATYEAEPRPTGTPASLANRTDVTGPGYDDPEIGCGA
jgi:hypothetical protein